LEIETNVLYIYFVNRKIKQKILIMEIPKDLLEKWEVLKAQGDPERIVESMPADSRVSFQTIRNAFNTGECSPEVFEAIAEFYKKRAERIAQFL
jgi:hypothetical protein